MKRLQEVRADWATQVQQKPMETQIDKDLFSLFADFMQENKLRILVTSAVLLIPIYWHRRIEAGDLASHVYNAWLVHLIHRGQAPGLWIAPQWNNILFDVMLSGFGEIFGLQAAERIAVSLAVLIFSWGGFALVAAATRRAPWFLFPIIAIFTYGWTFEMGLMNYYVSLGLSFLALAAYWQLAGRKRLVPLLLIPFIWMAHPLGVVWLFGSAGYLTAAEFVESRHRWRLLLGAGILIVAVRAVLARNFQIGWPDKPFFLYNGADQMVLFGSRYYIVAGLFMAFAVVALAIDTKSEWHNPNFWTAYRLPLELYGVAGMVSVLLPSSIAFSQFHAPISLLTQRLSSVQGTLACCILGMMKPRKWHLVGYTLIPAAFFCFLYQDTRNLNDLEQQVERKVAALPPGSRVVSAIRPPAGSRIVIQHIVDRACIGHCFSIDNFEPSSGVFRVRATPGNPIVVTIPLSSSPENGSQKAAQSTFAPQFEIYPCVEGRDGVCVRELSGGGPIL